MSPDTRHKIFSIRTRPAEHDLFHRAGDLAGEDASAWARRVLIREARQMLRSYLDRVSEPAGQRQNEPERAVTRD